jgi:hypothetical protein
MACSRSLRFIAALLALISVAWTSVTQASDGSCSEVDGIRARDARLLIVPNAGANSTQLTLSGHAVIADLNKVPLVPVRALCRAAIGDKFLVNKIAICSLFNVFSGQDTVKPDGNAVEFALSTLLAEEGQQISIDLPAGEGICADDLIAEVRPGQHSHFAVIFGMPKSLTEDRVEFEITSGARSQNLNIQVYINRDPGAAPGTMNAPKS